MYIYIDHLQVGEAADWRLARPREKLIYVYLSIYLSIYLYMYIYICMSGEPHLQVGEAADGRATRPRDEL